MPHLIGSLNWLYCCYCLKLKRILCTAASPAPVECIFSKSGLFVRSHRAHMSDKLLESQSLVPQCNWYRTYDWACLWVLM